MKNLLTAFLTEYFCLHEFIENFEGYNESIKWSDIPGDLEINGICEPNQFITHSFPWISTHQGYNHWATIDAKWKDRLKGADLV